MITNAGNLLPSSYIGLFSRTCPRLTFPHASWEVCPVLSFVPQALLCVFC